MTTEIISINPVTIAQNINFKDKRLQEATIQISSIYADAAAYADTRNREIAKILSTVSASKAYTKDGFTSVADYANKVFGINKNNAYALSSAGSIYNDVASPKELKDMTPSKLAELTKLDPKILNDAVSSGQIKSTMTQKELREAAKSLSKKTDKPVVESQYTARIVSVLTSEEQADTLSLPRILPDWDDYFMAMVSDHSPDSPVEIIKLPNGKIDPNGKKATITRRLYLNRNYSIVVEFSTYVKVKESKLSTPKFTREQLMKMLEEMGDEE